MTTNSELLFLVEEAQEGGYLARAIGPAIFTEADSLDELRRNIREAVDCHFETGESPRLSIRRSVVRRWT